jgi:hypothetical protein
MYTVKQLAAAVGLSAGVVYGWCQRGELAHVRLGAAGRRGKILIAETDWAAFLAARRVERLVPPTHPVVRSASEFKHVTLRQPGG